MRFLLTALLLLSPVLAFAQSVRWQPGAGTLGHGQATELQLVFDNASPEDDIKVPSVDGLSLQFGGRSEQTSIVNFDVTRTVTLSFTAIPSKRSKLTIPSFTVKTDKGSLRVPAATFDVGDSTVGQSGIPLDSVASSLLEPVTGSFWAGEVFPITYTLNASQRLRPRIDANPEWNPAPLTVEEWSRPEQIETASGGDPRVGLTYKTRGYIKSPGPVTPGPVKQVISLITGTSPFSGFFSRQTSEQFLITSKPQAELTIKPLPLPAPADFAGAVGKFGFVSKIVPDTTTVGEPITWTLELTGVGNWPDINAVPARSVSKDFQVLQPKAKRTMKDNMLFEGALSEDVVLIPTKPGTYTLEPVSFSYFDPQSGTYKTIKSERTTITVKPAASNTLFQAPQTAPTQSGSPTPTTTIATPATAAPAKLPSPASLPVAIPRDPLTGEASATRPMATQTLIRSVICALAWVIPAWAILAIRRSRLTDPRRNQRAAYRQLEKIIAAIALADAKSRPAILRTWQRCTADLFAVTHAAPTHTALALPEKPRAIKISGAETLTSWKKLWHEADRYIYGPDTTFPQDWQLRATAALKETKVPGWSPLSIMRPRNLIPWIPAIALLFTLATVSANATESMRSPRAAYDSGDFALAEKGWRDVVAANPGDWIARHNLALALSQQSRWPEAAAQWTSAYLLNPRSEVIRWHLALGYERAGYLPDAMKEFVNANGPHQLAQAASPGNWKLILIASAFTAALAVFILILRGYGSVPSWTFHPAAVMIIIALLSAGVSIAAIHMYGQTADPRAAVSWRQALLRSIPTEADTKQKTSVLPPGSLGIIDRPTQDESFIGWVRISLPNGQTGWVRKEDLTPLYK